MKIGDKIPENLGVDMNGNEVWLTGANWFGLNCIEGAPHYLWSGD